MNATVNASERGAKAPYAPKIPVLTIDGPAASGKSTVSRKMAELLGWKWVSTGAFYRGLAWVAHHLNIDPNAAAKLVEVSNNANWRVEMTAIATRVWYESRDITEAIKAEQIGNIASVISRHQLVRAALLNAQRQCAESGKGLVAEGRDCGTVVFPGAILKVYLTASAEARANRRALETGQTSDTLLNQQSIRDQQDQQRQHAPLAIPEGALVIDTSSMGPDAVVAQIFSSLPSLVS